MAWCVEVWHAKTHRLAQARSTSNGLASLSHSTTTPAAMASLKLKVVCGKANLEVATIHLNASKALGPFTVRVPTLLFDRRCVRRPRRVNMQHMSFTTQSQMDAQLWLSPRAGYAAIRAGQRTCTNWPIGNFSPFGMAVWPAADELAPVCGSH